MFAGTYLHNLDDKGRMIIPAKLRVELGECFYVTMGGNKCLSIYTNDGLDKAAAKLEAAGVDVADIRRELFGSAEKCEPDKQGRIVIPQKHRDEVGIIKDVYIVGVSHKCEIWSKENWEARNIEKVAAKEDIKKQIERLGL